MIFNRIMLVTMSGFIISVNMGVAVDMLMLMGMHHFAMPVYVGMHMAMLMGVLQRDGVLYHQDRGCDHNRKSNIELDTGPFPQQENTEENTQERRNGIIGAGFCCA